MENFTQLKERIRHGRLTATGAMLGDDVEMMLSLETGSQWPVTLGMLTVPPDDYPVMLALLDLGCRAMGMKFRHKLVCGREEYENDTGCKETA